jgi:hypothetical protein
MSNVRKQTLDFYIKSRDTWKRKNKENKAHIKYLKIRIRDLEKSRDFWKEKTTESQSKKKRHPKRG